MLAHLGDIFAETPECEDAPEKDGDCRTPGRGKGELENCEECEESCGECENATPDDAGIARTVFCCLIHKIKKDL